MIFNNTCVGNLLYGIRLDASNGLLLYGNVLMGNNGATYEHDASHVQAFDDGANQWNSSIHGNYWNDWLSPDTNGDGFVDEAYLIDGGNSKDHLPLALSLVITSPVDGFATSASDIELTGTTVSYFGAAQISWYNTVTGGSGICTETDPWTANVSLTEGANLIIVSLLDNAGMVLNATMTVVMDTTSPSLVITCPSEGAYVGKDPTVTWNGNDGGSGIAYYIVSIEGLGFVNTTDDSYTFNDLADGTYTVLVSAYDQLGNYEDETVTFTVDTVAPTLVIATPMEGQTLNATSVAVSWTTSDTNPVTVRVSIDNGSWETVNGDQVTMSLANGPHTVRVNATDQAGNYNESSVQFTVDTDTPIVAFVSPAEGAYVNSTQGIVEWEASDATSMLNSTLVRVDGGDWTELGAATGWIYSLGDGPHTIEVRVTDSAGNYATAMLNITVDTVVPEADVSPIGDELELDQVVIVEFSEQMNQTSVSVVVTGVTGTLVWEGNAVIFTPTALCYNRAYAVLVSGKDLAGNELEMNWTFATRSVGNLTGVVLDENGDPVSGITVTAGGEFTATTDENGRFVFLNLSVGNYLFEVDAEGYEPFSFNATVEQGVTVDEGTVEMVLEETDDVETGDGGSIWLYVIIIAVLAAAGVAAFVLLRKK